MGRRKKEVEVAAVEQVPARETVSTFGIVVRVSEEKISSKGNPYIEVRVAHNRFDTDGSRLAPIWYNVFYFGAKMAFAKMLQFKDRVKIEGVLGQRTIVEDTKTGEPSVNYRVFVGEPEPAF
jgi:hypothetical protein